MYWIRILWFLPAITVAIHVIAGTNLRGSSHAQVSQHIQQPFTNQKLIKTPPQSISKQFGRNNRTIISVRSSSSSKPETTRITTLPQNSSTHHRHQHHHGNSHGNNSSQHQHHHVSVFHPPYSHDEALLKINYTKAGGYFHVYDPHVDNSNKSDECRYYYDQHSNSSSQQVFEETIQKYRLWSGLVGQERMKQLTPNDTLFGFKHAIEVIWRHQHPEDCSRAEFLIPTEHNGGFGSELHVLTNPLGLAMDMGRVYLANPLLHQQSMWELEAPFCRNQSRVLGFDCYYEPWSSCTIFDALGPNAIQILEALRKRKYRATPSIARTMPHSKSLHHPINTDTTPSPPSQSQSPVPIFSLDTGHIAHLYSDAFLSKINAFAAGHKAILLHNAFRMGGKYIPRVFRNLVSCSPMMPEFYYYWWRAMTMTYFLRPNEKAMEWIDNHRNRSFEKAAENNNVVSVYVRRGDKEREMRISPMSEYTDSMRLIWSLNYLPNVTLPRVIFFASESSQALAEMTQFVQNHSSIYEMYYTNVFDRKGLFAEKSARERDSGAAHSHHPDEYLSMLLNIHHLLQGNAWVCTIGSNFCRVIDELRSTVAAKAGAPYVDLSFEKCGQPPCIYGGFIDMDWR